MGSCKGVTPNVNFAHDPLYSDFTERWKNEIHTFTLFLYPATQKEAGYYVIPSENFECPSVHPSVSALFPDSNLSSF